MTTGSSVRLLASSTVAAYSVIYSASSSMFILDSACSVSAGSACPGPPPVDRWRCTKTASRKPKY